MLTRIVETATDPTGKFVEIDVFAAPATAWTFEPRPPQHIPNDRHGSPIHENVGLVYGEAVTVRAGIKRIHFIAPTTLTVSLSVFRQSQIPAVIIDVVGVVPSLEEGDATTRFHHRIYWISRCVAARGSGAAAREAGNHWLARLGHSGGTEHMDCRICAENARTRLDRGPQSCDRVSLGRRTHRAFSRVRKRTRSAERRCHPYPQHSTTPCSKAGDIGNPDRVRDGWRSGGLRHRREPGATGRQYHGTVESGTRCCWQKARTLTPGNPWSASISHFGRCR